MTECSRFYKYFINYLFWFFCNSAPKVIQSIEKKMYPFIKKKKQIKGRESHKRISWELNSLSRVIEQLKFNYSKLTGFMRLARKKHRKTINVPFATIKKT